MGLRWAPSRGNRQDCLGWGALANRGTPFVDYFPCCVLYCLLAARTCLQPLLLHHARLDHLFLGVLRGSCGLHQGSRPPIRSLCLCTLRWPLPTLPFRYHTCACRHVLLLVGAILARRPPLRACPFTCFLVSPCLLAGAYCSCLLFLIVWVVFPPCMILLRLGPLIGPSPPSHRVLPRPVGRRSFHC